MAQVAFSVNDYDKDGDIFKKGIFLHFGETRVFVASSIDDFKDFYNRIGRAIEEIAENYPDA